MPEWVTFIIGFVIIFTIFEYEVRRIIRDEMSDLESRVSELENNV